MGLGLFISMLIRIIPILGKANYAAAQNNGSLKFSAKNFST